jgi:hypothetical protein
VHPSPSSKDNIPGFVALVQQKGRSTDSDARPTSSSSARSVNASSLLLAWMPEYALGDAYEAYVKVDPSDSSSPSTQSHLVPPPPSTSSHSGTPGYAFALPVSEIYSLLVRPPSIGWWFGSVVVNTRAGDSFPALFFHDSECQSTILQRNLPVATGASFDSHNDSHNARCLPITRTELLDDIATWANSKDGESIFWLRGMAGTGKSTIARTVALLFTDCGQLGARFFFKKGEGDRGNASRFFTTIATDLVAHEPGVVPGIRKALDEDSKIADKSLKDQFEKLILQPLLGIKQASRRS